MSHNKIKVNSNNPNINGDITVNLSDLITVNSAQIGQFLKKSASDWQTGTLETSAKALLNYFDDNGAANTAYTYASGDVYDMRKVAGEFNVQEFTMINSSGSYVSRPHANSSWVMAFEVKASVYPNGSIILFRARIGPYRGSGSSCVVQWYTGDPTTAISDSVNSPIGNKAYSDTEYGGIACGLLICDGNDIKVSLRVTTSTGTIAQSQGVRSRVQQITAKQLA
mgnify:CR=1 FL=1